LFLTFIIAFVAERILQPRIRRFLDQRFSPALQQKKAATSLILERADKA
jgi:hypothetical protein